jgi:hypothetical protein
MPYALCLPTSHISHHISLDFSLRARDEGIGVARGERKSEVCENAQFGYYRLVKNGGGGIQEILSRQQYYAVESRYTCGSVASISG